MKKIFIILSLITKIIINANELNISLLIDNSYLKTEKKLLPSYTTKDLEISFEKNNLWINTDGEEDIKGRILLNTQSLSTFITINKKKELLFKQNEFNPYGQKVITLTCNIERKVLVFVQTQFGSNSSVNPWFIHFEPYVYEIDNGIVTKNLEIVNKYFYGNEYFQRDIVDDPDSNQFSYPYFNEEKILNRLYETGTCDKELTQKANIEVLVGDKWIAQEQSWNIKKEEISNTIQLNLNEVLKNLKEKKETNLPIENLNEILKNEELNQKTVQKYNDIAYYLQQKNVNNEAIFLLEKIIEKFPNRIVAYLNLADAYDGLGNKEKAKKNYGKYINLMKQDNKEVKIPKRVLEYK
ncbi:tetratricopeptide repeat protein [Arcobacter venerupis]|uniref:Tetratricopeptide repeat protein n=1 Tax=Arcobacter venerupis TaxID=1054033 RepID=A0AAE7BAD6_9BACT|nr:tetratricopeptide repeat protein [Arcobacter venerupis]QKF66709.1 tetratricopeptide repeat protein [Arcobacter venerupis]RWS49562.1 hypothetical protein CKA56_07510 [Arcobacter venerupis]